MKTQRLVLRHWKDSDLKYFAQMNADPRVMKFYPALKSFDESAAEYRRILDHWETYGFGRFAVEEIGGAEFIGSIGLLHLSPLYPFAPGVEIGWRLMAEYWGKGYATEGATAVLEHGFKILNLPEIVAFTSINNLPSKRVMEKLRMIHDPNGNFDHPTINEGNPQRTQVLFRIHNPCVSHPICSILNQQ